MSEQNQQADILEVLAELNRGKFMIECGRQLHACTEAVIRTGKKGKLTITFDIDVASRSENGLVNRVELTPTVTAKEPQPGQGKSLFFVTQDAKLSRQDPDDPQMPMFEEKEQKSGR